MTNPNPNPLLEPNRLPIFSRVEPSWVEPAVDTLLAHCRSVVQQLTQLSVPATWENLVAPLESALDRLNRLWSPISHLHSVADSDELRDAYNAALAKLSAHATELGQNQALFERYRELAGSAVYRELTPAQRQVIDNALLDFELAGIGLPQADKDRFRANAAELATLGSRFQENVLDASNAWKKHITDLTALQGVPPTILEMAAACAEREGLEGWLLTLDIPCYLGVVTHAKDRALRSEIHRAYTTRASEQGLGDGRWDNTDTIEAILRLRHAQAQLLGRDNYAELSLARKMASSPQAVMDFLTKLAERARPAAEAELAALREFAREALGLEDLAAHDIAFCSERLRENRFDLSQETLRPYFPVPRVLSGMFEVARRLFGIEVREVEDGVDLWDPLVQFFEIHDEHGSLVGEFYLDLYARARKRGGAWMDECVVRRRVADVVQTPVAYLTCNFAPPGHDGPSRLTHDEVTTLFHEFGHGLHHLLTQVDHAPVSGINGVAWDAVELPSQLMENWCWEEEALALISAHADTGAPLPPDMLARLRAARTFQAGMQTVRQLEFALFDFRVHLEYEPERGGRVYEVLDEVREMVAVTPNPDYNRFAHAFTHIFGGGYAAGYYSYKWAEALSADAFSKFQEAGIFDRSTGEQFKHTVLEQGGACDAMALFVAFRGREPSIDALLHQSGLDESVAAS